MAFFEKNISWAQAYGECIARASTSPDFLPCGARFGLFHFGGLYYSLLPGLLGSILAITAGYCLLWPTLRRSPSWIGVLAGVAFPLAFLLRNLGHGALGSGSDVGVSFFFWILLLLLLFDDSLGRRFARVPQPLLLLGVMILWSLSDLSWTAGFVLLSLFGVGLMLLRRFRQGASIFLTLAGVFLFSLLRPDVFQDLLRLKEALLAPANSFLRASSGWMSPNFQFQRELVLGIFLAVWGPRLSGPAVLLWLCVILITLLGEFGAVPLGILVSLRSVHREAWTDGSPFQRPWMRLAFHTLSLLLVLGLVVSREEPRTHQRGLQEAIAWLHREHREAPEERSASTLEAIKRGEVLFDYRAAPEALLWGVGHHEKFFSPEYFQDYQAIMNVEDDFDERLKRQNIRVVILPEEGPLVNVLQGRGTWRVMVASPPTPFFYRGLSRELRTLILIKD